MVNKSERRDTWPAPPPHAPPHAPHASEAARDRLLELRRNVQAILARTSNEPFAADWANGYAKGYERGLSQAIALLNAALGIEAANAANDGFEAREQSDRTGVRRVG